MVALVDIAAIFGVGSLVGGHVNVRESTLATTARGNDAARSPEKVKATAPVACAAEGLALLHSLISEHLVVVADDPASGDLIILHAISAVFNELPFHPETWVICGPSEAVVPSIGDEANVQIAAGASVRVVHNAVCMRTC